MTDPEYIKLLEDQVKDYQRLVALFKEALTLKEALIENMRANTAWGGKQ